MDHEMKLFEQPFELIRQGSKVVEIRLNDEKRQQVRIGDRIIFSKLPDGKETLTVRVSGLLHYETFRQFYEDLPAGLFGYPVGSEKSVEEMLESTYTIYTREQEKKYGALGIRIQMVTET